MVYITEVHMVGGNRHEHIGSVRWRNPDTGVTGESTRDAMVEFIRGGNVAEVTDGRNTVRVHVVEVNPPYIQTVADGKWTDNLLALQKY